MVQKELGLWVTSQPVSTPGLWLSRPKWFPGLYGRQPALWATLQPGTKRKSCRLAHAQSSTSFVNSCCGKNLHQQQLGWRSKLTISSKKMAQSHRSLSALVTQSTNCPLGVNTTIELMNVTTTSDKNGIKRGVFQQTSVPVLSDAVVIFFSSILVSTPNCDFWIVPLLHSESDITMRQNEQNEFKMSVFKV